MGTVFNHNQNLYTTWYSSNSTSTTTDNRPWSTSGEFDLDTQPDCKLTKEQVKKRDQERKDRRIRELVERMKLAQPPDRVPPPAPGPADFEEI